MIMIIGDLVLALKYFNREVADVDDQLHGHVSSISVLRSYRRLGIAKKLMIQSREHTSTGKSALTAGLRCS